MEAATAAPRRARRAARAPQKASLSTRTPSGACAFFRVGEAVLFTFAFFWLLWTSKMHDVIIWLPVLALFLGMFVRAGEAIVFRLGQRLLSAAEELLPFSPAMMQGASTSRGGAQPPASRESRDREPGTNGAGRPSVTNGPSAGGG